MASFAFQRLGPLLLAVQGTRSPADVEWAAYLEVAQQLNAEVGMDSPLLVGLTFTDGGVPNSAQRLSMSTLLKGRAIPTAVLSDSVILRAMMKLMGYVNPGIQGFSSAQWPQAAAFIGLATQRRAEVLATARQLGRDIGGSRVLDAIPG